MDSGFVFRAVLWFDGGMSTKMIEKEVAELKERVAQLEKALAAREEPSASSGRPRPKAKDWTKIVGAMKDCDLHQEAMRLGAEWRARMNAEGR